MSNNLKIQSKPHYQLTNSNEISPRLAFLNSLYYSLKYSSGDKVDMYTLFQISKIPLIVSQKLILNSFHNKMSFNLNINSQIKNDNEIDFLCLSNEEFVNGFNSIYFGSDSDKTNIIANLCSFSKNQIYIKDVTLLLNHCHMRFLHDDINLSTLKKIINNFFEDKEIYSIEEFITKSLEKNYDIIEIFLTFFDKFKFFNNEQIKLFEHTYLTNIINNTKSKLNYTTPAFSLDQSLINNNESISTNVVYPSLISKEFFIEKSYKIIISKEAEDYINLIKKSFMEFEPFEAEDNEMRRDMEQFDKDLYETISSLQRNVIKMNEKDESNNSIIEYSNRSNKSLSPYQKYYRKMNKNNLHFAKVCKSFFNQIEFDTVEKSELTDSKNYLNAQTTNHLTKSKLNLFKTSSYSQTINIENSKYVEIFCLKLAKTLTKFKRVKLILAGNLLFYYTYDKKSFNDTNSISEYKLKSLICTSQLFPVIINNPLIPNNLSKSITKNKQFYQFQIFSTLHNNQIIYNFFLTNKEDIEILNNHIIKIEQLREINDNYNLTSKETIEIGRGHFGKVLLCPHKITEEKLAVKVIYKNHTERDKMKNINTEENIDVEREEIRKIENFKCIQWEKDIFMFLSNLRNAPNIVKCYEWFENSKCIYYINEYCDCGNIKKLTLPKNISLINAFTKNLISGLYTLHSYGIIHRDIKNTNTLLKKREDGKIILKIIDFGLSKVMGINEYAYEAYGSLPYKTPEQLSGKKYNFSVDIWALGISIYWLIYNNFPVPCQSKHKMKKLLVKYEYNNKDKSVSNLFCYKILSSTLINDYKKRSNVKELLNVKDTDLSSK